MTRTFDGLGSSHAARRSTLAERTIVLGGFAVAAVHTAVSVVLGSGVETVSAAWMAATVWAAISSLALALRRGFRHRDWSAFGRHELPDNGDTLDWSTRTGAYAYLRVAEEHQRLMRGD